MSSDVFTSAPAVPLTARERGKIAPVKLAHIVYKTARFDEMVEWYKTVLEAEVVMGSPMVTFLSYDDEHHRIAFINNPGLENKAEQASGVDHCAFTYNSVEDLFATYERLATQGIQPYWCINHGATLSMYYQDPDQNQIELQIDVFATNEEVTDWLQNSDFDSNPIGVKFDPEDLIRRHRSGESRNTLLARPVIDPSAIPAQFPG